MKRQARSPDQEQTLSQVSEKLVELTIDGGFEQIGSGSDCLCLLDLANRKPAKPLLDFFS